MFKFTIFDLDGTLLNTLDDLANAGNYTLSVLNFPIHQVAEYKYFVGNGIPKLVERILPNGTDEKTKKKALETFCSYYNEYMNNNTAPYNGIIEMLTVLKEKNIGIAVVTNKAHEFAVQIVEEYFGNLVDKVYGSIEGMPKKPDPFWVNKAISYFGAEKSEVLYIGDSGVDMETAVNAQVTSCGVLWGFRTETELTENGAVHIVSDWKSIIEIICGIDK